MKPKFTYSLTGSVIAISISMVIGATLLFSTWNYLQRNVVEFRFEHKEHLWYLLIIPVLGVAFMLYQSWQNSKLRLLADAKLIPSLTDRISTSLPVTRFILLQNALALLIIAFANPQYGTVPAEGKQKGAEIMLALDISNSMLAEDQKNNMNRLKSAKLAINRILPQLKGDKLGVVVFAGEAFTQVPMTNDYGAIKLFLNPVDPTYMSLQGTAVGSAIETCMASFSQNFKGSKAIIVISDGENHEDDALSAAKLAVSKGITIHTIGIGSTQGSPIPVYENGVKKGLKRDEAGNTVITKLNESILQEVAQAGGGTYVRANNAQFGLETLLEKIYGMQKAEYGSAHYAAYDDQFMPFLLAAFILLVADMFVFPWKKRRRMVLAA